VKNNFKNIRLVATDLDGTFLRNDHSISPGNMEMLHQLGKKDIVRVAATGRNLQKVRDVLHMQIPFDYVVYSSGAGVFDWKKQQHVCNQNITSVSAKKLINYLVEKKLNFNVYFPTPENHRFWHFRGETTCEEFERYLGFNAQNASELTINQLPESDFCQFLIIIPENENQFVSLKKNIESICGEIRVIRASSPVTKGFIWVEVFHHSVSKGNGVKHICNLLNINRNETLGLGNDYNDFDLLEFTNYSFLTENSPDEIKHLYPNVTSNENDAFYQVTQPILE